VGGTLSSSKLSKLQVSPAQLNAVIQKPIERIRVDERILNALHAGRLSNIGSHTPGCDTLGVIGACALPSIRVAAWRPLATVTRQDPRLVRKLVQRTEEYATPAHGKKKEEAHSLSTFQLVAELTSLVDAAAAAGRVAGLQLGE
jgi:hypothetical protein